jgi:8-oxo-dGTP pyrophosphatase MutT (NUDIX family)
VFVAEVDAGADVVPNDEFGAWRWVDRAELADLRSPLNVRQFGYVALDAKFA